MNSPVVLIGCAEPPKKDGSPAVTDTCAATPTVIGDDKLVAKWHYDLRTALTVFQAPRSDKRVEWRPATS